MIDLSGFQCLSATTTSVVKIWTEIDAGTLGAVDNRAWAEPAGGTALTLVVQRRDPPPTGDRWPDAALPGGQHGWAACACHRTRCV
jgi:hypothetical protein